MIRIFLVICLISSSTSYGKTKSKLEMIQNYLLKGDGLFIDVGLGTTYLFLDKKNVKIELGGKGKTYKYSIDFSKSDDEELYGGYINFSPNDEENLHFYGDYYKNEPEYFSFRITRVAKISRKELRQIEKGKLNTIDLSKRPSEFKEKPIVTDHYIVNRRGGGIYKVPIMKRENLLKILNANTKVKIIERNVGKGIKRGKEFTWHKVESETGFTGYIPSRQIEPDLD